MNRSFSQVPTMKSYFLVCGLDQSWNQNHQYVTTAYGYGCVCVCVCVCIYVYIYIYIYIYIYTGVYVRFAHIWMHMYIYICMYGASLVAHRVKNPSANAGDVGSIPGSGRSPGEGNDYPLHYSCLENSMDIGAWRATVHGVSKSQTRLYDSACMQVYIYAHTYECLFFHWECNLMSPIPMTYWK